MNYQEAFEQHTVHTVINDSLGVISQTVEKYPDCKSVDEILKLQYSLQYVKELLARANYYVTPKSILDNISCQLNNVKSYLSQYLGNRSNQLQNAVNSVDVAMQYTAQIVLRNGGNRPILHIDSKELFEKLQKATEQTVAVIDDKTSLFEEKTDEVISQMDVAERKFEATQTRVDTFLANLQTSYNTSEEERGESFQDDCEQYETQFKNLLEKIGAENAQKNAETAKSANALLTDLGKQRDTAAKILQIVSNTGFAGNYSKNADAEKKNADVFRWLSIIIFGLVSVLALITLFTFQKNGLSWQEALVKILASSLPSALATYLARESSKHRKLERKYRNMELELSALDAFIENLPVEKRNDLKEEITRKLFSDDNISQDIDVAKNVETNTILSLPETVMQPLIDVFKMFMRGKQ